MNSIRYAIGDRLKGLGLPVGFWSGGRTKYNRLTQGYPKDHWLDAACVGGSGANVKIPAGLKPLQVKATGRQARQMCRVNKYGFPRTKPKQSRFVRGFQTGDRVKAVVPTGKKAGTHVGRVAVRAKGSFRVGPVDGLNWKYPEILYPSAAGRRVRIQLEKRGLSPKLRATRYPSPTLQGWVSRGGLL